MCRRNLLLHFSFVMFFDREKCQGGQTRRFLGEAVQKVTYDDTWHCPCCCYSATALEIVMIRKRKNAYYPAAGCVTHGMNSDFWNANKNMFITQSELNTSRTSSTISTAAAMPPDRSGTRRAAATALWRPPQQQHSCGARLIMRCATPHEFATTHPAPP
jgi:hypothetical protein